MKKHLNKILFFTINILLVVIVALIIKGQDQKNKLDNASVMIENSPVPTDSVGENAPVPVPTSASPTATPPVAATKPIATTPTTTANTQPKATRTTKKS
ncbi:MAG: hypothetical protein WA064_01290 [Candidatus Moraniibacteriota bacterium]